MQGAIVFIPCGDERQVVFKFPSPVHPDTIFLDSFADSFRLMSISCEDGAGQEFSILTEGHLPGASFYPHGQKIGFPCKMSEVRITILNSTLQNMDCCIAIAGEK